MITISTVPCNTTYIHNLTLNKYANYIEELDYYGNYNEL